MDEEIIYLLNRFPKHKKLLMDSYANNEEFRSMCQAFYNSAITIEKCERNLMNGFKNRKEYEGVYSDLESAIARSLKSFKEAGIGNEK
jgi:hypothetical protein